MNEPGGRSVWVSRISHWTRPSSHQPPLVVQELDPLSTEAVDRIQQSFREGRILGDWITQESDGRWCGKEKKSTMESGSVVGFEGGIQCYVLLGSEWIVEGVTGGVGSGLHGAPLPAAL